MPDHVCKVEIYLFFKLFNDFSPCEGEIQIQMLFPIITERQLEIPPSPQTCQFENLFRCEQYIKVVGLWEVSRQHSDIFIIFSHADNGNQHALTTKTRN